MNVRKLSRLLLTTYLRICSDGCNIGKVCNILYIHTHLTATSGHNSAEQSTTSNIPIHNVTYYGQMPSTISRGACTHRFHRSSLSAPTSCTGVTNKTILPEAQKRQPHLHNKTHITLHADLESYMTEKGMTF